MADKRNSERLGIRLEVEVEPGTNGDKSSLHTRDISNSGVFLECCDGKLPEVGSIVVIRIKQALGEGEAPAVKAEVVRIDKDGIALKFLDS